MKKVIVHSNYDILNKNNNMFNNVGDVSVKDFLKQMGRLKQYGLNNGVEYLTSDGTNIAEADAVLFIDMPAASNAYYKKIASTGKSMFLLVWESGIINHGNSNKNLHHDFAGVFTYDDSLIDNNKYFKVAYAFEFPKSIPKSFANRKLCCLIAGNKASDHPLELYSKRLEAIRWFEKHKPLDFDFYGQGWTKIVPPKNIFHRAINKYRTLNRLLRVKHICYRGEAVDKSAIYRNYRFSICYENAKDLTGYISEKIFDCLFAGCLPVYWGADNVCDHIPSSCFIDMRSFRCISELHEYLVTIRETEYLGYLAAIEAFLETGRDGVFSLNYFAEKITSTICQHF